MLVELKPEKNQSKTMVLCGATVVMQHLYVIAVVSTKTVTIQGSKDEKLIFVCVSTYFLFTVVVSFEFQ